MNLEAIVEAGTEQNEPPDNRGPAIVVTGSVSVGFEFTGPFESIDAALKWYEQSLFGVVKLPVTISLLSPPLLRLCDGKADVSGEG